MNSGSLEKSLMGKIKEVGQRAKVTEQCKSQERQVSMICTGV